MLLLKPSHTIESPIDREQILRAIERAGRTCKNSGNKTTEDSAQAFMRTIIKLGHESVLEHEKLTVRIVCDRGITHQLVRHDAAFSQESTRYCDYIDEVAFIIPPWVDIPPGKYDATSSIKHIRSNSDRRWYLAMLHAEEHYQSLRSDGWVPEKARAVLPSSTKAEIVVTMNLREWRHFFELRTHAAAHPQMREIALAIFNEIRERIPELLCDY